MKDKRFLEINPVSKEKEILSIFKEFNPKSFSLNDKGYEWLEEGSKCIVICNPFYDKNIEIVLEDKCEFTLYFSVHHSHYAEYQSDYEYMIENIKKILNNQRGVCAVFNSKGEWSGSCFVETDDKDKSVDEILGYIYESKEYFKKLLPDCKIEFNFWEPQNNKIIQTTIDKF